MVPEQESNSASPPPERRSRPPGRRGGRSGRGRRGRGPRPPASALVESEPPFEEAIPTASGPISEAGAADPEISTPQIYPPATEPAPRERVPAAPASVQQ